MAKKHKKAKGGRKMVCPKTVRAGKRTKSVSAHGGICTATRKDGSKARVRKVPRGHRGPGSYAKRGK